MNAIPRLLVLSFAFAIAGGTVLLLLPGMMRDGATGLSFLDALFTSTSAVCVTGLIVRDTPVDFSMAGQSVILILIQIGGLGILTFSNAILFARSRSFGLRERLLMGETVGAHSAVTPAGLLIRIFAFTFACEFVGAVLLTLRFAREFPFAKAVWMGVFHSISAFCNAGFSLFSDNLIGYQHDVVINLTIMGLIILGGIGFVVAADCGSLMRALVRGIRHRLSFHSNVVLRTTGVLIFVGWLLFILLQSFGPNPHGAYSLVIESLFLSVTARTAGFNTIDIADLSNPGLLVLMMLMVIGGSPGSTAGGIKTTTAATLFALVNSRAANRPKVELLRRSIPHEVQAKAFASTALYITVALIAIMLLELTGSASKTHRESAATFLPNAFEVISALSTVGLSTGITPTIVPAGKLVLIACMFIGRLGTLVVAGSIIGNKPRIDYTYPEEKMMVG